MYGYVVELSYAIETLHIAGRADVDTPAVVEQLVAADEDVAHKIVAVESCSRVAVGEVVEDADVAGTLYADAVITAVFDNIAPDDLSFAFGHRSPSVHSVSKTRLVFDENAVVAATYADAVRYDEVLVLVTAQPDANTAAAALAFRPIASALYHAYIIYQYSIEEVNAESCGGCATQYEVIEDSIRQRTYVESFTIGGVGGWFHLVAIDREVFEAHTLNSGEVALLRTFSDEKRPVAGTYHLEHGTLY